MAGPGTGKTTMFKRLLEARGGDALVVTFINNLKNELEEKLSKLARVFTFHGYCRHLLHRREDLRAGLTDNFRYFPGLASLIKRDWQYGLGPEPPHFVRLMRNLERGETTTVYLNRSNYYDAVEFDDSVFRVHERLAATPEQVEAYDAVIVDEYQDFNRLETSFISLLADRSPIVVVGDDDQALYSQLKGASHDFIRQLHSSAEYERFELPFCLRCPEAVVNAIGDIVERARKAGNLQGRIDKPYRYFPPVKARDSERYPWIEAVRTSVQRLSANYFGKYIAQAIRSIPEDEVEESIKEGFPTVLIIGAIQYLRQIVAHLRAEGFTVDTKEEGESVTVEREDGLRILKEDPKANLGWRIVLEFEKPDFSGPLIKASVTDNRPFFQLLPAEYRTALLEEVNAWEEKPKAAEVESTEVPQGPTIKATSFEGSKGLSAQHVFVVGLHEGEMPRDRKNIEDLEICRFIVALTRTRKQCHLMCTRNFSGVFKKPSVFFSWIRDERLKFIEVNKDYWK